MAEIVNLRRARKASQRLRNEAEAAANRTAFGVAKSAKQKARAETELAGKRLEAHRIVAPSDGESE
jgi:hypothetical protein